MAKTNAERQAAYRARHLASVDGALERLNIMVGVGSKRALERLAACHDVTLREALENAVQLAEERTLQAIGNGAAMAYYERRLGVPPAGK